MYIYRLTKHVPLFVSPRSVVVQWSTPNILFDGSYHLGFRCIYADAFYYFGYLKYHRRVHVARSPQGQGLANNMQIHMKTEGITKRTVIKHNG